ncbi:methyltransferase domain-containing protein [Flammeovirga agarivorans]|uniref:Methyltransferase domain-containing protein n=1 Tax=Flammeovirga agarivorans TaxID=2726742 RepID=A0A7X8SH49_9BACT|nr:methyltransferase domain-containing protein [Flammeovirga agarivorans]NLR90165.1 methyltransferase domain-containing protein [Flammeovirga agarivorans]
MELNKNYWKKHYKDNDTGWDIGYPSTPIKEYIDQLTDKSINILIPGVGNGYELEYLWNQGFKNVYAIDITEEPIKSFLDRVPDFPKEHLFCENFFDASISTKFDLIIEQTFFCALNPNLRVQYVEEMHRFLNSQGKLAGLLFKFPLTQDGPPFGGSIEEYQPLFSKYFSIEQMEDCYNSIPPRQGNELFFILRKK